MTLGAKPLSRLAGPTQLALWLAAFAFGLLSLALARSNPAGSFGGRSWLSTLAGLAAGWGLIGAGLHVRMRRPVGASGYLLAAAGVGWFFVEWVNPGIGSSLAFTFGLVAHAMAPPMVAHAVLAYPSGSLQPLDRFALLGAYVGAGLVLGLLPALFFDPQPQACHLCPDNLLAIRSDEDVFQALNRWGVRLGLVWTIVLAALAVRRLVRSSPLWRRMAAPVLLGGIVYLLLVWAVFLHGLPRGGLSSDPFEQRLWLGQAGALFLVAGGVAWSWLRARRTRSAIARLVVDLGESPPPGALRDVLARALEDSELQVAYPLVERDRYVDARGITVDPAAFEGRTVTPLVRAEETVAVLVHRPRLLDDPGLVEEVISAASIALDNERLQAEVRAQLEGLRASRSRIVETGDAERRRLERDLHDGAQQRLVGLSLALRLARAQLGPDPKTTLVSGVDQAEAELRLAIDALRELAHGIFPAVLSDEGLAAAVEALAEHSTIPILAIAVPEERFPGPIEAAAYFLIAEASGPIAGASGATGVTLNVGHDRDKLRMTVTESGADGAKPEVRAALVDLEDRVGALDGRLWVEHGHGKEEFVIRAEIPCES